MTDDTSDPPDAESEDESTTDPLLNAVGAEDQAYLDALADRADEMDDDAGIDFDSTQRQDDGWVQFYVECPDCRVPMAQTLTDSTNEPTDGEVRQSATEVRCVCPNCRAVESVLKLEKLTAPVGEISEEMWSDS